MVGHIPSRLDTVFNDKTGMAVVIRGPRFPVGQRPVYRGCSQILGLLHLVVLVSIMLACVGCCPCEPQEQSIEGLSGRNLSFISRRGAQTYIEAVADVDDGNPAKWTNALYTREYSDLMSHFGQYKPVLAPLLEPADELGCRVKSRVWNPDAITQIYLCAPGEITLEIAYMSEVDVAVRVSVSEDWASPDVPVTGCAMDNGDSLLVSAVSKDSGSVIIDQTAQLWSFWGAQQTERRTTSVEVVPWAQHGPDAEGLCWSAVLNADVRSVVSFRMEELWGSNALLPPNPLLPNPGFNSRGSKRLGSKSLSNNPGFENGVDASSSDRLADDIDWPPDSESFDAALDHTRFELDAWFNDAPIPDWNDRMALMSWFIAWENSARPWGSAWTRPAVVPSKRHYFRGVWLWDSAFTAITLAQGNYDARELGREQVRLMIDNQAPDGRLPREIWAHDVGTGFQPPGPLTWAAIVLSVSENDYDFIAEVYDSLVANHRWIEQNTDSDGDGRCEWSREDSGMDTSPRFDDGPVEGVDLQAWMALDALLLERMAYYIGLDSDREHFSSEAERRIRDLSENFWDDADQMYYDRRIDDSSVDPFVRVVTPASFLPLLVGAGDDLRAAAMAAHLSDPTYLGAPYGVPTASPASIEYEPENYWRGPVWIVTNAFVIWGLEQYGLYQESNDLRDSTLSMIAASDTTWEYYNSQTGAGLGASDFMWSGAFYLLLSEGISPADVL